MTDMKEKKINPTVKLVLELGPVVLFFVAYTRIKDQQFDLFGQTYDGFIVATAAFIPVLLISTGLMWWLSGKLSKMQVMTAVLVLVFGGMSVWFNDERFFKMKTTIVYGLFSVLLGIGLLRGQSYLAFVMNELMPMREEGWMILTRRLCAGFAVLAIANEFVWRTMSTDAWVKIETFGFPILLMAFLMWQFVALQSYAITDEPSDET